MKKHLARIYLVQGRVQGVGYRFFVEAEAKRLGLRGFVRNLYDGRVEVYAVGDEAALDGLRRRLEQGPPASRIEHIEQRAAGPRDYKEFVIEATAQGSG